MARVNHHHVVKAHSAQVREQGELGRDVWRQQGRLSTQAERMRKRRRETGLARGDMLVKWRKLVPREVRMRAWRDRDRHTGVWEAAEPRAGLVSKEGRAHRHTDLSKGR